MIVNIDVRGLEVVTAAWLSRDKTLYKELNNGLDIHSDNQNKFGLPDRITAKIFKFKLLYGAMEYGFANDPDFTFISTSPKYWRKVIDKYYQKYSGIASWHEHLLQEVSKSGIIVSPFGRIFKFDCYKYGSFKLPSTQIKNYPVQGTGADIVSMARVSLRKRWKFKSSLINTVHDSIVVDAIESELKEIIAVVEQVFKELPEQISRIFGVNFDLEIKVEIQVGHNQYNLHDVPGCL